MNNKKSNADKIELDVGDALLVIDIQNDFLPVGSLAVPEGEQVIPVLNGYIDQFVKRQLPVFATRDWHPSNHCSFIQQGGPWPEHCITGSKGAEFSADLHLSASTHIISTGIDVDQEGYSGFENPVLKLQLDNAGVSRLFIGGLATDYCVLSTVRDALNYHYKVLLLIDAIRAVNVRPQDGENAINEMIQQGAKPITLSMIR
ncbi:MAG: isochorismatase family protein [Methylobacter sp.]